MIVEIVKRVIDEDNGNHFEVGPDRDGEGLCELISFQKGIEQKNIVLTKEEAVEVAKAILELYSTEKYSVVEGEFVSASPPHRFVKLDSLNGLFVKIG
jgi:hypothetical protein